MEELAMYRLVKRYYDFKLFSLERVKQSVAIGWITEEEYKEITGLDYEPLA